MPEEEVKGLALDLYHGSGRWSYIPADDMLPTVFIPIALGALKDIPDSDLGLVGAILGDGQQISPRGVNGRAVYYGGRFIHRDDWARITDMIRRLREAEATILA